MTRAAPDEPAPVQPLIDTHAHLDDHRLAADLDGVLARAHAAGVVQVVAIGTTAVDSASVVRMAEARPGVFAAVGIHPNEAAGANDADWSAILELAGHPEVVAIGETGLDRHWDRTPFAVQQEWFDRHLELARRLDRPVVIHARDCTRELIDQLRALGRPVRGVQHSFTGTWDDARDFLDLGLHLSFAGMVTYTNRNLDALREVAARVPLDRILVETDSPYLSPHPFRGRTNEPARVAVTAQRLAEVRGIPAAELARATTENARRLLALPPGRVL
ncbi:MAG: TatD family hydrolase [Isosphaeraceae bacterium]